MRKILYTLTIESPTANGIERALNTPHVMPHVFTPGSVGHNDRESRGSDYAGRPIDDSYSLTARADVMPESFLRVEYEGGDGTLMARDGMGEWQTLTTFAPECFDADSGEWKPEVRAALLHALGVLRRED